MGKLFLLRELCPGMSSLQLRWGDSGLDKLACQVWRLRDVYWNINGSKQRWIEMDWDGLKCEDLYLVSGHGLPQSVGIRFLVSHW